jgi:hypothetical protein
VCDNDTQCPSGWKCQKPTGYCGTGGSEGCQNGGVLVPADFYSQICMPPGSNCICDCDNDGDCSTAKIGGQDTRICVFDNWSTIRNYCHMGTLGNPCNEPKDCATGFCSTNNTNVCTEGTTGQGCGCSDTDPDCKECKSKKCYKNHCVEPTFDPAACAGTPTP